MLWLGVVVFVSLYDVCWAMHSGYSSVPQSIFQLYIFCWIRTHIVLNHMLSAGSPYGAVFVTLWTEYTFSSFFLFAIWSPPQSAVLDTSLFAVIWRSLHHLLVFCTLSTGDRHIRRCSAGNPGRYVLSDRISCWRFGVLLIHQCSIVPAEWIGGRLVVAAECISGSLFMVQSWDCIAVPPSVRPN